jgi:hypothetical protein
MKYCVIEKQNDINVYTQNTTIVSVSGPTETFRFRRLFELYNYLLENAPQLLSKIKRIQDYKGILQIESRYVLSLQPVMLIDEIWEQKFNEYHVEFYMPKHNQK